jgi:uncharacterized protein (UPF0335 family)
MTISGEYLKQYMDKIERLEEYLKQYIDKIERLEEEKTSLLADIRDVYAEAKGNGFDAKIMREIIKKRKLDRAELEEQETLLDLYKSALGMM